MKLNPGCLKFVRSKKVLIVDGSASLRSNIAKSLSVIGFRVDQVFTASTFVGAQRVVRQERPRVIITDYFIGDQSSLELLSQVKAYESSQQNRLILLITNNSSESSVAEAAEEDVDGYLLKPFNKQEFENYFFQCVSRKLNPSEYQSLINTGKESLERNELDEALKCFNQAKRKVIKPSLAWYYSAEVLKKKNDIPTALINYRKGLSITENHYKCLIGLFDLYRGQENDEKAYETLRTIAAYFPFNPQRLADAVSLAVKTGHYSDVDYYYAVFQSLEQKSNKIEKMVSSALLVSGIYFLKIGKKGKAKTFFKRAVYASGRDTKLLKQVILNLVRYREIDSASKFMKEFSSDDLGTPNYMAAHYILSDATTILGQSINLGRKLLKKEIFDPEIYRILIKRTLQAGYRDSAEHLAHQASSRFPESQDHFLEIVYRK